MRFWILPSVDNDDDGDGIKDEDEDHDGDGLSNKSIKECFLQHYSWLNHRWSWWWWWWYSGWRWRWWWRWCSEQEGCWWWQWWYSWWEWWIVINSKLVKFGIFWHLFFKVDFIVIKEILFVFNYHNLYSYFGQIYILFKDDNLEKYFPIIS